MLKKLGIVTLILILSSVVLIVASQPVSKEKAFQLVKIKSFDIPDFENRPINIILNDKDYRYAVSQNAVDYHSTSGNYDMVEDATLKDRIEIYQYQVWVDKEQQMGIEPSELVAFDDNIILLEETRSVNYYTVQPTLMSYFAIKNKESLSDTMSGQVRTRYIISVPHIKTN